MLEEQCPRCGVFFRKFLAGLPARSAEADDLDQHEHAGSRALDWLKGLLEAPPEGREIRSVAGPI